MSAADLGNGWWLGVNFWSVRGGPRMWRHYDAQRVRAELRVLARHGLGVTRSFLYWPDFMPEPDRLDEGMLQEFGDFLDAHAEVGMRTLPTLLVGHMSGANWDPAWRAGRNLYRDVGMVAREAWYAREVARRFAGHGAVCGWVVSNEMPIYGGEDSREAVASWAQLMVDALRAGGATQPISIGDGAWGIEASGHDSGYSLRDTGRIADVVAPHVYPVCDDAVRQHLHAAFECQLARVGGKPVVLEEFGASSDLASDDRIAAYYRQVLTSTLLAGSRGWIAWNNTDFDPLVAQRPYREHPFELHFGVTRADGAPKPALGELRDFSALLKRIDFGRCRPEPAQAAILMSSFAESRELGIDEADRRLVPLACEQGYVAAREADIPVQIARESPAGGVDGAPCGLYLIPSTKALVGPTWPWLAQQAERGAVVYASYFAGEEGSHPGAWWIGAEQFFGVERALPVGSLARSAAAEVRFDIVRDFGSLRRGETLRFPAAGRGYGASYLPVAAADAQVLAVDQDGRPALLARRRGRGWAVLSTYPTEYMAARRANANPEDTWRIYRALADVAGARRGVEVDDPEVLVGAVAREDGARFVAFASQSGRPLGVEPVVSRGGLVDADGAPVERLELAPFGVRWARWRQ